MRELASSLLDFGMSDKEASVYLAMLELGPSSVQDISKKTEVNRATVYALLESLKQRGLVSSVERGLKTVFAAESPEHLARFVEEEQKTVEEKGRKLQGLMPTFLALFNAIEDKPKVRYFEGEEGAGAAREVMLGLARGSQAVSIFISYDKNALEYARYNEPQRLKFTNGPTRARVLYAMDDGLALPAFGRSIELRRLPEGIKPFHGELNIFDSFISVCMTQSRPIVILMESPEVARLFQSFFDAAWQSSVK